MKYKLLGIVNTVRENKGLCRLERIRTDDDLRRDLEFDSLDLAELTVRIEKENLITLKKNHIVVCDWLMYTK